MYHTRRHYRAHWQLRPASINFADYVRSLSTNLFYSYGVDHRRVRLQSQLQNVALDLNVAVCGLLINELITNSLKHAFPDNRRGEIRVELSSDHNRTIRLMVADTGVGFPRDLEQKKLQTLGLKLVEMLADQLDGTATVSNNGGATVTITFPITEPRAGTSQGDRQSRSFRDWLSDLWLRIIQITKTLSLTICQTVQLRRQRGNCDAARHWL